ncbi:hypothetical protein ABT075_16045 [Streptomyces sp. NPDC002677]
MPLRPGVVREAVRGGAERGAVICEQPFLREAGEVSVLVVRVDHGSE